MSSTAPTHVSADEKAQAASTAHPAVRALHNRAATGVLHAASTGNHPLFSFWQGQAKALTDLLQGVGDQLAAKDAASGAYQPPAGLQAAWPALTIDIERAALVDVEQRLAAQAPEFTADDISDFQIEGVEQLKHGKAPELHLHDEHAAAEIDCNDGAKHRASIAQQPPAPYTLHFTRWACGHHQQRPADIPVHTPEQGVLIALAIAAAISQPGSAEAFLLDEARGERIYIAEDHISMGFGSIAKSIDPRTWMHRPVVYQGDADTIAQLHAPELVEARNWLCFEALAAWDGKSRVAAFAVVTTTLSPAAIEAAAQPADKWGQDLPSPFELPPVLLPATELLRELQEEAAQEGAQA